MKNLKSQFQAIILSLSTAGVVACGGLPPICNPQCATGQICVEAETPAGLTTLCVADTTPQATNNTSAPASPSAIPGAPMTPAAPAPQSQPAPAPLSPSGSSLNCLALLECLKPCGENQACTNACVSRSDRGSVEKLIAAFECSATAPQGTFAERCAAQIAACTQD
ncbi:MAG: hypothetical protein HY791_37745 [Deltaproteobacteria bacterium]|nr:hypothetical protein [Deltaproteobacteria bacterium]